MPIKLVVSDKVAFPIRFTLNVEGKEVDFGFRLEAKREVHDTIVREAGLPENRNKAPVPWLRERVGLRMVSWIGESPLKDADSDTVIAAGDIALDAIADLVSNVGSMVHVGYLTAISAKGKSGN
jgi:hypothetical protein